MFEEWDAGINKAPEVQVKAQSTVVSESSWCGSGGFALLSGALPELSPRMITPPPLPVPDGLQRSLSVGEIQISLIWATAQVDN